MRWDGRIRADARHLPIANESVQCVVTSPPYWKLRKYDVDGPQIGQESSIEQYIESIRAAFRELWRVLRCDGTVWVELGDSWNSGTAALRKSSQNHGGNGYGKYGYWTNENIIHRVMASGLKRKDLVGLPWLVAFALRADGWWLRQEIIWHKTQGMPESITDRPSRNHNQLFLLAKSERYYFDMEAIKEPASPDTHARYARGRSDEHKYSDGGPGGQTIARTFDHMKPGVTPKSAERGSGSGIKANSDFHANCSKEIVERVNKRSVWSLGTAAYPEAHYATFPPDLVEPCILAGSRPGDLVLDPFAGSGTVLMVAEKWGRRWIGTDLGYQDLQAKRLKNVQKEISWLHTGP